MKLWSLIDWEQYNMIVRITYKLSNFMNNLYVSFHLKNNIGEIKVLIILLMKGNSLYKLERY